MANFTSYQVYKHVPPTLSYLSFYHSVYSYTCIVCRLCHNHYAYSIYWCYPICTGIFTQYRTVLYCCKYSWWVQNCFVMSHKILFHCLIVHLTAVLHVCVCVMHGIKCNHLLFYCTGHQKKYKIFAKSQICTWLDCMLSCTIMSL